MNKDRPVMSMTKL